MNEDADREPFDLDRILELARLELDPSQRARVERDLRRILRFAAEMGDVEAPPEDPRAIGGGRLREDEAGEQEALRWRDNAPRLRDGWFVVPDHPERS